MQTKKTFLLKLVAVLALFSLAAFWIAAQTATVPSLITAPVDETKLTVLPGNTHPLARPQFDRGLAPGSLAMEHILLVLKQSPAQQAALEKLLADQQDKSSPNYHKWLSPDEFGQQFGASEQDIQTVRSWLQSHGFQVNSVTNGRNIIDFSGTAAQVQSAFHTEIHSYVLNSGEQHWANASDPAIPTALTAVVAGVRSLNNFFPKPLHHMAPASKARTSGVAPQFTFPTGCTTVTSSNENLDCQFGIGPADFAKIYSVPSQYTGSGETIAIVSGSDVVSTDLTQFRTQFGLPSITINATNNTACAVAPCFTQIDPNSDPGVVGPTVNGGNFGDEDEVEAILDVEWAGAVATGANIDLVASADTNSSAGIDLSAMYIVNFNGDKGLAPILSESYGVCELGAGTSGNIFYNNLWSQAAGEGITVLIAAGDNGSASCDTEEANGFPSQPALSGLQVNAIASTPYDVAVGATDFNDFTNPFTYFGNGNGNNATTQLSAKGYIPETTWNDTCTNSTVYSTIFDLSSAAAACNSTTVQNEDFVIPVGGSGGRSNCTSSDGENPSSCAGGYAKPAWQTGPGVLNDGKRDLPDISLFGADGLLSGSFYVDCEADFPISNTNNTPIGACDLATENFLGFGGTSVSTQAFAGIMALIDQSTNSKQGNANPTFYALAAEESSTTCNSSGTTSTSCPFNDVTVGTNAMPCLAKATNSEAASPDCPLTSSGSVGILTDPTTTQFGFNAGTGYDLATGVGTPNVSVLIGKWGPNFYITASSPTVTVPQGSAQSLTLTVTGVNLTGPLVVNGFSCPVLPSLATCTFTTNPVTSPASVTLTPANPSQTVTVMVSTTASSAAPAVKLIGPNKWTPSQILALSSIFCMGAMFVAFRGRSRRWSTAFALIAFAALVTTVACGGGGSSSGGGGGGGGGGTGTGGTPKGTTTATVTATNGTVTTTMNFTLTVD
jgi:subtilase family serine protease